MSIKNDIKNAFITRLRTITSSNGYSTGVVSVYDDRLPMGINLETHEVPAIIAIAGEDKIEPRGQNRIYCEWMFYLQLIHGDVTDDIMFGFIGDVGKALFANSPTADRQDEFRTIHPSIYQMDIIEIEPDLNMIDANRFAVMAIRIKYVTKYNSL
jgi:hypothetical protein